MSEKTEPWLRGSIEDVNSLLMPAAHALLQAAEDIQETAKGLNREELWMQPNDAPSIGFHLMHIAGSIDRLLTYADGENLTREQFELLATEGKRSEQTTVEILIKNVIYEINRVLVVIKSTSENELFAARSVGRRQLPTNVFGLLFHIAEHTQRHVGQVITTAKFVRAVK